jgi:hypothetical protein
MELYYFMSIYFYYKIFNLHHIIILQIYYYSLINTFYFIINHIITRLYNFIQMFI